MAPIQKELKMTYTHNAEILRLPQVIAKTGLSRTTIYNRISDGLFPKPVNLGPRAVGWLNHEVNDWIDAMADQRDSGVLR